MEWVIRRRGAAVLVLLALCGFLFCYGLTAGDLYRTENLRAIIAADFLRSGDWLVPRLYGEPLLTKPPGMYAAIALVSWPFGDVTTWSARLPTALAATATVLLVYWYFGRQLGRLGGLLAALLLPTSLMWLDKVPTAEIDVLQVAWVTAAVLFFLRSLEGEPEGRRQKAEGSQRDSTSPLPETQTIGSSAASCLLPSAFCLLALLCVAGGFLTKWTAPAFFYATVIPLLWWRGQLRFLFGWRHLLSVGVAAAICLGWAALVVREVGWDVLYETVSREALQRLSPSHHLDALQQLSADHQPQMYPWAAVLLHPFRILATNLPWSVFALATLWPGFVRLWDERGRRLLQALHCWLWPNLLFWSIIPEHAPRHSFPLFPAISGLAAMVWLAWLTGRLRWPMTRLRPQPVLVGLLAAWMIVKVVFVEYMVPQRNGDRAPRAKGERLAATVPPGKPLYVFRLKDEGIMFYYGRQRPKGGCTPPVQRRASILDLPSSGEPVYCILDEVEWRQWPPTRTAEPLLHLADEQGAPIVLVRVSAPDRSLAAVQREGRTR